MMQLKITREREAQQDLSNLAQRALLEHQAEMQTQPNPVDPPENMDIETVNVTNFVNSIQEFDQIIDYFEMLEFENRPI